MATITDDDFEGSYPPSGYSEAGTTGNIGTSTVQANSGVTSMRVLNSSSASCWIADPLSNGTLVMRFHLRVAVKSSGTCSIVQLTATGGNVYLRLLAAGGIRLTLNTTNFAGPTLTDNQWYLVEMRAVTSANPWVVDWKVDGANQPQGTLAVGGVSMTAVNVGFITSGTCDLFFDDLKVTDTSGDYPLGAYVPPVTTSSFDAFGMMGVFGGEA